MDGGGPHGPPPKALFRCECWFYRQNPSLPQLPEQQARLLSQRSLRCAQRQAPLSQRREQQSESLLQKSPLLPQSQLPLRQTPEQQPRSRRHLAPCPAHWHLPLLRPLRRLLLHLSEQQSPSRRHLASLTRQLASRSTSLSCAIPSSTRAKVRSAAAPPARPATAVRRSLLPATIRVQLSKRQSSTSSSLSNAKRTDCGDRRTRLF